jgi:probable HAF family extracellular repeat protein
VSAPIYAITNLGTLHGNFCPGFVGENSFALGLNSLGQVVGGSCAFAGFFERVTHAFLYNGAAVLDLRALGPGCDVGGRDRGCWHSVARGINGAGQVVGSSSPFFTFTDSQAFLYANGAMTRLLPAATRSDAFGINDSGQVVGWFSTDPIDISVSRAFLFSGAAVTDLGTLGGTRSLARAINNAGHVVGQASISGDSATHAFMYDGVMRDLGTLGGANSFANSINGSDQVIGSSLTPATGFPPSSAEHAFLYSDSVMHDLGTLGGSFSAAFGTNDAGEIVGTAATAAGCCHAFLFRAGTMIDLNELIPAGSGWVLTEARAINRSGQIAGTGIFNGEQRAFLLTPSAKPPTITETQSPLPNSNGWNNSDVTVSWTLTDPTGITSSNGCATTVLSAETAGATLTCIATNGAGLSASKSVTVKIDKTPPETLARVDPAAKDFLVFGRDALSGVAPGAIPPTSVTAVGEGDEPNAELRTYLIRDLADNTLTLAAKVKKDGSEIEATIVSLRYNDGAVLSPVRNQLDAKWTLADDGSLARLNQKVTVGQGDARQRVTAVFRAKDAQTTIVERTPGGADEQIGNGEQYLDSGNLIVRPGLVLLQLATVAGGLVIEY